MLLISSNLVQVFSGDLFPQGWIRYAWMLDDGTLVACLMQFMPEPEIQLLTSATVPENVFAASLDDNSCISLQYLLSSKERYQETRVHLLRASPNDLIHLEIPMDVLQKLQRQIMDNHENIARIEIDSHQILWFWDLHVNRFARPVEAGGEWTEELVQSSAPAINTEAAIAEWKSLTSDISLIDHESSKTLFTCFDGHAVPYSTFVWHTQRVNEILAGVINGHIHLCSGNLWLPSLMCPTHDCCQQVTPSYITRRAVLQQMPVPPVLETTVLLRTLKQLWNL